MMPRSSKRRSCDRLSRNLQNLVLLTAALLAAPWIVLSTVAQEPRGAQDAPEIVNESAVPEAAVPATTTPAGSEPEAAPPPSPTADPDPTADPGPDGAADPSSAGEAETEASDYEPPAPRFERWIKEVELLITAPERRLFATLKRNYQRDAFIQQFWKVRDPYPKTPRNELKERWPVRMAEAKSRFGSLDDDRARTLLVHGSPVADFKVMCTKRWSAAEVWVYDGTDLLDLRIPMIFISPSPSNPLRLWNPARGYYQIEQILKRARTCINGNNLQQAVAVINADVGNYSKDLQSLLLKPRPRSLEWVNTFVAHSTELPLDAVPLDATEDIGFLGRHQHRTVVQAILAVPVGQLSVGEFAGYRSHDLQLTGEVIRDDTLFETFRYKFGFTERMAPGAVPLVFQRYLRPGTYRLVLKLEDLNSSGVYRSDRELEVPLVDELYELPTFKDPRTEQLFSEATAAIAAGETGIRLIPPRGELQTGFVRFDSLVTGEEITKVRFYLDDRFMLAKNKPPYNVEIDLGSFPDLHVLRAEALNADGHEVASDEILINSGGYRFTLKLVEPRKGQRYSQSLRARAEIEVPDGRTLERVEFFLNENRVATLYQEPWVQPIVLPEGEPIAYVRAIAYLPDGNSTEDLVFINAPDYLEELEIQFVELYTTVLDAQGRPVDGIVESELTVLEDGVEQQIARFERVEDLPIHVGILIDNSASMVGVLGEVRNAALSFFEQAIQPRDRAAVITFNNFPHLAVELTNDRTTLGAGLAGLVPEGRTALYDSVMFSLYYFTGIKGQRAILVLSDGKDEASRFNFAETLDYARRAGITIYSIGLLQSDSLARGKLTQLADETGGRAFFIRDIAELSLIYSQIQRELRSQYLIAYQSSNTEQDEEFRAVELKIDRPNIEVKTLSGYYP